MGKQLTVYFVFRSNRVGYHLSLMAVREYVMDMVCMKSQAKQTQTWLYTVILNNFMCQRHVYKQPIETMLFNETVN